MPDYNYIAREATGTQVTGTLIPFFVAMVGVLMLITYWPTPRGIGLDLVPTALTDDADRIVKIEGKGRTRALYVDAGRKHGRGCSVLA